jgi:putative inorganic carbon (HCO3(-)) transporter
VTRPKSSQLSFHTDYEDTIADGRLGPLEPLVLFLLPILACFGPLMPVAGPMFAFRVAIFVLLAAGLVRTRPSGKWILQQKLVALLTFVWVVASLLLLLITQASKYSWMELTSVLSGLVLLMCAVILQNPHRALRVLNTGWLFSYFLASGIGLRELVSGEHLSNYLGDRVLGGEGIASTFGNPNDYAFYLVASIPLFFLGVRFARSVFLRTLYIVALLSIPVLMAATQSRFGIVFACVIALSFGLAFLRFRVAISLITASIAIAVIFPNQAISALQHVAATLATNINLGAFSSGQSLGDVSAMVRLNLIKNGILFMMDSNLLGLGPGGFVARMESGNYFYPTSGILSPHSGFVEIASQYGVVVLIVFVALLVSLFTVGWRAFTDMGNSRTVRVAALTLAMLVGLLPVTTLMASSFLHPSTTWVFLAVVVILGRSIRGQVEYRELRVKQSPEPIDAYGIV